jgi:hypothetical protein
LQSAQFETKNQPEAYPKLVMHRIAFALLVGLIVNF